MREDELIAEIRRLQRWLNLLNKYIEAHRELWKTKDDGINKLIIEAAGESVESLTRLEAPTQQSYALVVDLVGEQYKTAVKSLEQKMELSIYKDAEDVERK